MKTELVLVLDSIRSLYNVGSLFRLADGLGVTAIYTVGITPHPTFPGDRRLPHVIKRVEDMLAKTALGAQDYVLTKHFKSTKTAITKLKDQGFQVIGLEQSPHAVNLDGFKTKQDRLALVIGNELTGVSKATLQLCDVVLEIPMKGKKNSLNVTSAASITVYYLQKLG